MPLTIDDVEQVQLYFSGVIGRSEHHAQTVGGIALALLGAILWRKIAMRPLKFGVMMGRWVMLHGLESAVSATR
jgi:hypothetical protein